MARIAGIALAPLADLRDRVRAIDPAAPRVDRIARPEHDAELEDLRAAIAELVERLGAALAQARSFASNAAHALSLPHRAGPASVTVWVQRTPANAGNSVVGCPGDTRERREQRRRVSRGYPGTP